MESDFSCFICSGKITCDQILQILCNTDDTWLEMAVTKWLEVTITTNRIFSSKFHQKAVEAKQIGKECNR